MIEYSKISRRQNVVETICPECHKKAWLRRIRVFWSQPGWLCTRCKQWWTDGYDHNASEEDDS